MSNFFSKIPTDKYYHFGACSFLSLLIGFIGLVIGMDLVQAFYCGFVAAICTGFGKEYGDKVNPNNYWDWTDILANLCGATFGSLINLIIGLIFF